MAEPTTTLKKGLLLKRMYPGRKKKKKKGSCEVYCLLELELNGSYSLDNCFCRWTTTRKPKV